MQTPMRPVELRELMLITIDGAPHRRPGGRTSLRGLRGGTFEGRDGLSGTVLDGGVDWQTVRPDGVLEIDAHYTLRTEADEAIEVRLARRPQGIGARGGAFGAGGAGRPRMSTTSGPWSGSRARRRGCTG